TLCKKPAKQQKAQMTTDATLALSFGTRTHPCFSPTPYRVPTTKYRVRLKRVTPNFSPCDEKNVGSILCMHPYGRDAVKRELRSGVGYERGKDKKKRD